MLGLAIALAAPAAALAQCPQTTLGEVEQEVMCPICGTPLALATEAPQAQRQRAFINERVARCDRHSGRGGHREQLQEFTPLH